jgi:hypothetical protein
MDADQRSLMVCLYTKISLSVRISMSMSARSSTQPSPIQNTYNQHQHQLPKQGETKIGRSINVKHDIGYKNLRIHISMIYVVRKARYSIGGVSLTLTTVSKAVAKRRLQEHSGRMRRNCCKPYRCRAWTAHARSHLMPRRTAFFVVLKKSCPLLC